MDLAKNKITHDRVFAAADSLYKQAGRVRFPTVAAVRREAGVDMTHAIAGMAQWRADQTAALRDELTQAGEVGTNTDRSRIADLEARLADQNRVNRSLMAHLVAIQARITELEGRITTQEQASESLRAAQTGWMAVMDAIQIGVAELEAQAASGSPMFAQSGLRRTSH